MSLPPLPQVSVQLPLLKRYLRWMMLPGLLQLWHSKRLQLRLRLWLWLRLWAWLRQRLLWPCLLQHLQLRQRWHWWRAQCHQCLSP